MGKFTLGSGVTATVGPFKGMYGVVIYFDKKQEKYLVRFNGQQQLYLSEEELTFFEK